MVALNRRASWGCVVALAAMWLAGCNKEKLNELVEQGKQKLDQGVQQAKQSINDGVNQAGQDVKQAAGQTQEMLQLAGNIELNLDTPVKTSGCYAKFIPASAGRPALLRIQSYRDARSEAFPSVYLRAVVTATQLSELQGQTVPAVVYAQTVANGPVWVSSTETPVQLKIVTADPQQFVAEIASGGMLSTAGGSANAAGKLQGIWLNP